VAIYSYKAIKQTGDMTTGSIEAENEREAAQRLQDMNCYPLMIERPDENEGFFSFNKTLFDKKPGENDVLIFSYQLGVLLESGFPLDKGLSVLVDLTDKKKMREIIKSILASVRGGKSLSDAISKFPETFTNLYINMVRAGESGGFLEQTLFRVSSYLENFQEMKDKVRSALIYPVLLAIVGGVAIMVLIFFVVPRFSSIFSGMEQSIPLSTKLLINFSSGVRTYWWAFFTAILAAFLSLRTYLKSNAGKKQWDSLKYKLPLVGQLYSEMYVAQFARTLGTLLQNGVPLLNSLQIVKGTSESGCMTDTISAITEGVRKGNSISGILKTGFVFPKFAVHMINVGEETGRLNEMLIMVADRFDVQVKNTIKKVLSLMEPVFILIIGIAIGFIVISMLLAVFSLNDIPF